MHVALALVALVVLVGVVAGGAERRGWSPPVALVLAGIAVSFVPGVPRVSVDPDLVLIGLLPPLLYSAAIRTSLVDFTANRRPILSLSIGAVAFTTVVVGLVAWWVVPAVSLAAGFALGAVVAPPDAIAASAVARRVGMPRRIVAILEGESLVNDATALVALTVATAALTRTVGPVEVVWRFALAAGGGAGIGLVVGYLLGLVRQRITDPVLDTTLSFVAPWLAFLPAEEAHASGVLAVVVAGLYLGYRAPQLQTAASRIAENTNWATVAFVLENGVFVLIGLQLRGILNGIRHSDLGAVAIAATLAAVFAATVVARILWTMGATAVLAVLPRTRGTTWSWRSGAVVSWAGMRGVVTLAAAFLLPDATPERGLLQLAAFVVVAGTLLIQGQTLPWLVRVFRLPPPSAGEEALQAASLRQDAVSAALLRLDRVVLPEDPPEIVERLRERADYQATLLWERLGPSQDERRTPYAAYRRLRLEMLDAEREVILSARKQGRYDSDVLRAALQGIDTEEALFDRIDDAEPDVDSELTAPSRVRSDCDHLRVAPGPADEPRPGTPGACVDCLAEGTTWVHLRECLTCGHVGCCDSSVRRHATGHFHRTQHPVMRSVERGEAWRWCYVDEELG